MQIGARFSALFLGSAFLLAAQAAGRKPVTLDDFLAYQKPAGIAATWAPDGKSFFYEQDSGVSLYKVAERRSHEWFKTETLEKAATPPVRPREFGWQNRRVSAASYQWLPNSQDLLAAVDGDLFLVHPKGKPVQLTATPEEEEDPRISPDGTRVLYRSKSNLYVLDIATRKCRQLTHDGTPTLLNGQLDWVYPEELDLGNATWWSPDSRHIAYLQFDVSREFLYPQVDLMNERALSEPERYPQAGTPNASVKLGAIELDSGQTRWMQVGETTNTLLARVAWLPDSSQIAVERFSRVQDKLDLLFCDPQSGSTRIVLHEESKTWLNAADNLIFLKTRPEFLWTSERSGFRHIYRYSNQGSLLGQLTSGDWEVVAISAVNEAQGRIYYTSSEASPLETQFYSVPLGGGKPSRITMAAGTHGISANGDGSYFLDSFSSLQQPDQTTLSATDGGQLAVLRPPDSSLQQEYALLPEEFVTVKTAEGTPLFARLLKPAHLQPGTKYPVVVMVYGGPGAQTVRNRWYGISWEQVLASRGYVVWQLDNRGSKGRGVAFEAPLYRRMGFQEVADQRLGVEHLIRMGLADPERIGIMGYSYGGYMTLRSLLFAGDLFKVGVAGAPVTDWRNYDTIYTERYMGLPAENAAAYDASSNVKNAGKLEGKLLIIHNLEDDNVLFQNTMQMAAALEGAGKRFFMQIYPQKTHGIGGPLRRAFYEQMSEFFDTGLKNSAR